jgi:uncharacterized membrane protein HdeD (DUF308 family)
MSTVENKLAAILSRNWWVLLLRGLAAIAFGVLTWTRPGISLATMILFFGSYTLFDGILGVWAAIGGRKENDDWWVLLLGALVSIGAGLLALTSPGVTALVLLFYIAGWAIAKGVLEIVAAIRLRKEIEGEWRLVLGGLASVLAGLFLMSRPGAGALALVWLIASLAILVGVILVMLSLKVRAVGAQAKVA